MSEQLVIIVSIIELVLAIIALFCFIYLMSAVDGISNRLFGIRDTIENKRNSPVSWAKSLNDHFLQKGDEEGIMLMTAVLKKLSRKHKSQRESHSPSKDQ